MSVGMAAIAALCAFVGVLLFIGAVLVIGTVMDESPGCGIFLAAAFIALMVFLVALL